jgi:hypothetical protein
VVELSRLADESGELEMKHWMKLPLAVALLVIGADAAAQYYQLSYRDNDPFVFCTQGQNPKEVPAPCWKPLPPFTGNFMMMPYCKPPSYPYGKSWTNDDWKSLGEYLVVCPWAKESGGWKGEGSPESSPHEH